LIYEYPEPVTFELDKKAKQKAIKAFADKVYELYRNDDLVEFILDNQEDFFGNILTKDYKDVPKGIKLIKAFKYFEKDENALKDVQNMASQIIQEDKVTGTLCLSIHPLDFLSTSENAHNWRSCHALDGEYRAGNLAYMGDYSTIIAYLKSSKGDTYKLPNFPDDVPWNSKKWRALIFFSDRKDIIFAGRQYPFASDTAMDFIKDKILAPYIYEYTDWETDKITSMQVAGHNIPIIPSIPVGNKIQTLNDLIVDAYPEDDPVSYDDTLFYNDLKRSTCYDPMYAYRLRRGYLFNEIFVHADEKFHIGKDVKCFKCGRRSISSSESMVCSNCYDDWEEE
jgi:hypothetical protein